MISDTWKNIMAKNLIVQFFMSVDNYDAPTYNSIGVNEDLYHYSVKSVRQYAGKIGVE